jgi:hypothetical protein
MITTGEAKDIFEAISTLSDVQELIAVGGWISAGELVNHAKRHLLNVSRANEEAVREAMLALSLEPCTL